LDPKIKGNPKDFFYKQLVYQSFTYLPALRKITKSGIFVDITRWQQWDGWVFSKSFFDHNTQVRHFGISSFATIQVII
jgi:hypothetical protein